MSTLLITLPLHLTSQEPLVDCVLLRDDGTHDARSSISIAKLPQGRRRPLEIIAVAPIAALSWHRVTLPTGAKKLAGSRLRAVLEGALEDQLLDDPAQLHFALQPHAADGGSTWVAACDRRWISDSLNALAQNGHTVSRIVPEWAPLGTNDKGPATLCFVGTRETPVLVCADANGVRCLPATAASLDLLANDAQPGWSLEAEPMLAHLAEDLLKLSITVQTTPQRILIAAQTDWDLAQFEFAVRSPAILQATIAVKDFLYGPRYRGARWALATAVAVQLIGLNAWAWQTQQQLDNMRSRMSSVLLSTYPQVQVVIDAPLQMERELTTQLQASGAPSSRDLETLLGAFVALTPTPQALSAIEFAANELKLHGVNLTAEQIQSLDMGLKARGLAAKLDGAALVIHQKPRP